MHVWPRLARVSSLEARLSLRGPGGLLCDSQASSVIDSKGVRVIAVTADHFLRGSGGLLFDSQFPYWSSLQKALAQ